MHNYSDLLEQRTSLKAMKETMFNLNPKEDFSKIDKSIYDLSVKIRSYNLDETPTQLLSEPENIVQDDFIPVAKPPLMPLSYENFYSWNRDKIMKQITTQLIDIQVPLGVYAIFKNTVIKSDEYIMKHYYKLYLKDFKDEKWISSTSFHLW